DHRAAADPGAAVDEDRPARTALLINELHLSPQPVDAWGRRCIQDGVPAVYLGAVGVFCLADVEDGACAGRRLLEDAAQVEAILDARVVRARVAFVSRAAVCHQGEAGDGNDGGERYEDRPEFP